MAAALEGRVRLLVFDNCEHVLDAAADLIEAILARSTTVQLLATSREGLRVADEQLWPVPSLDVLSGVDSAAATLFVQRAAAVAPGISLAGAEAGAVVEICGRLDGIPLAIELAASRMQSMTVSELRDRLDDRFRLLVGSRRGLDRHHTLRHAVAWSYDLLDDAEKTLLERCSVFAGGFDLAAARAVGRLRRRLGHTGCARCAGAQVPAGRRPIIGADPVFDAGDDPPVRRRATCGQRRGRRKFGLRMRATSPDEKPTSWPCGTAPASVRPTTGSLSSCANLRTAFRWATDHGDLDAAATIATYAGLLGSLIENYEPITVGRRADRARPRRRPPPACVPVRDCVAVLHGRTDRGGCPLLRGWPDAMRHGRGDVPFGLEAFFGGAYLAIGQPVRWAEWCRTRLPWFATLTHSLGPSLVLMLNIVGSRDEAIAAADGLIDAAEATRQPVCALAGAARIWVRLPRSRSCRALDALRRGLVLAQDSGNRNNESNICDDYCLTEAELRRLAGRARSRHSGDAQLPRRGQHRRDPYPAGRPCHFCSTGSDTTNRRPP